jgi:tRNA G18 (ribose-2'-O)-methylase SpoU
MEWVTDKSVQDSIDAYRAITDPAALRRDGLFVAEGRFVVRRLLTSPRFTARSVLVTPVAFDAIRDVVPPTLPCYVVDQPTMDSVAGFNVHRGCLALAERPDLPGVDQIPLETLGRVVVLEGVGNPDNIGGIFRSAAAFGAELVVLGPGCGDPFYRKAIRTSMAATLDVPIAIAGEWPAALDTLRVRGLRVVAFTPAADAAALDELSHDGRLALLFGTEGEGLSAAALAIATHRVRIRTTDRVDSLNVTVAASIGMHHCFA